MIYSGIQKVIIYLLKLFPLQILIGKGTDNPHCGNILLSCQVHFRTSFPDFLKILPRLPLKVQHCLYQKGHQNQRNNNERNIDARNQHQRGGKHKNCIQQIGNHVGKQLFKHDGITI